MSMILRRWAVVAFALVGVGSLTVGFVNEGTSGTYGAVFDDAGAILDGSDVKVAGMTAGRVATLELVDGQAHLRFDVAEEFRPLYRDATLEIRPVSLLGERYVALDRGTPEAGVLDPATTIGADATGTSVDLDQVLDAVDDPTGTALAAAVVGLGEGMAGRGEDVAELVEVLAPALNRTDELVSILDEQNQLLASVVDRTTPVVTALGAERGDQLDRVVGAATDLLASTASSDAALRATLERLPSTLANAEQALLEVSGLATQATTTLRDVEPITGDLTDVATELDAFAAAATPALGSLDPVLEHGRDLLDQARPVVDEVSAGSGDLEAVATNATPIVRRLTDEIDSVLEFIRNWALVTNGRDAVSHYFRAHIVVNPDTVTGMLPVPPPDLPLFNGDDAAGPAPEDEGDTVGNLVDNLGSSVRSLPNSLEDTVGGVEDLLGGGGATASEDDSPSATGLSAEQEQSLFDVLLGGS